MTNLNGKLILTVLLMLLLKMCICSLASDTFRNSQACNTFFHAHIMSRINYVSNVWDACSDVHIKKLKAVHKRAVKVLCAASPMLTGRGHISYGPLPLKEHLQCNKCILVH